RRERRSVDSHAGALDVDEHGNQRPLEVFVDAGELFLDEQIAKDRRELPYEIRALGCVIEDRLDGNVRQRHGLRAAAADVLLLQRLVADMLEREVLEQMLGARRVDQI